MTAWVDQLKEGIPDYAKDTKLNIDAVIKRSKLDPVEAQACALAAAFATGNTKLWTWIHSEMAMEAEEADAAITQPDEELEFRVRQAVLADQRTAMLVDADHLTQVASSAGSGSDCVAVGQILVK